MELIILGSGTAVPTAERGSSGLVVLAGGEPILFDSGSGTLQRLVRAGVDCRRIKRVFYTHLHPDHTSDLVPMLFVFRNPDYRREARLTVTGPRGFREFYEKLAGVYGHWVEAEGYELQIREVLDEAADTGSYKVTWREVLHSEQSVGYRVEDDAGRVIAYSGDTAYCHGVVELGKGADILVLECSFPDGVKTADHLTPHHAGRIAAEAGCRLLVLTHFYPQCQGVDLIAQVRKTYGGEVVLATDLLHLRISG